MKIAIIGAGLSGSILYRHLKEKHAVTIFEKSRGAGGRLSTKYVDEYFIDHGTPFFKTSDLNFKTFSQNQERQNILRFEDDYFYPQNGTNKICSSLINKNDLKTNQRILKADYTDDKWNLYSDKNEKFSGFDKLIITTPAPQILQMDIPLNENIKSKLESVNYNSIFTIISYGKEKLNLKKFNFFEKLIDNSKKYNYKDFKSYVFHSSFEFANSNNNQTKEEILQKLFDSQILNKNDFKENRIIPHLWKYAIVKDGLEDEYLYYKNLAFCGDYFKDKNLESSYNSSLNLLKEFE